MTAFKKIGIVFGVLIVLLLGVIVVLPLVVDVDQYRPKIVAAAGEKINGKLELGKLKLSLWGQIRIEVDGLKLSDAAGNPVLSVSDAFFHLPFLSILSGSPELTFQMNRPEVNVVKDKAGKLNVMGLMKPETGAQAAGNPAAQKPDTAASGKATELPSIAAKARLGFYLRDAQVTYRDLAQNSSTSIKDFNVVLKDLSLSHPTGIQVWADLDTQVGKSLTVKGPFRLDGQATPTLNGGKFEKVALTSKLDADQVEILMPGLFHKQKGMATHVDFAATASTSEARIEKLVADFFNVEIRVTGAATHLESDPSGKSSPVVDVEISSNDIDLKPWSQLVPMLKDYELAGHAKFDASAKGPSELLGYRAKLKVEGLTAKAPHLKAEPRVDMDVSVVTDEVEHLALTMKAPGNDLRIQGKVAHFKAPKIDMQVLSSGMDLDQLINFPPPGAKTVPAEQEKAEGAPAAGAPKQENLDALLDPLRENPALAQAVASIAFDFKLIKAEQTTIRDLSGRLYLKDLTAGLDKLSLKIFGGTIAGNMAAELKPKIPKYRLGLKVDGLDLAQAVESQMALFKNTVLGKASFEMNASGESFNPEPAKKNLKAQGNFKVANATFTTIDVGRMVSEGLTKSLDKIAEKVPPLKGKTLPVPHGIASKYELVSSNFTIDHGVFSAPNFYAKSQPNQGIDIRGQTDVGMVDKSLKTNWEVIDTYNLTKAKDLSVNVAGTQVNHILTEGNDPLKISVSAGCTVTAPCYSYAQVGEELAKVAAKNVGQSATKALKSKAADQLIQKAPPNVQDKLKGLKGKLFGG